MKLIIAIFMLLALSGCIYQKADQWDIYRASKICNGAENIMYLSIHSTGAARVVCKDGRAVWLYDYKE